MMIDTVFQFLDQTHLIRTPGMPRNPMVKDDVFKELLLSVPLVFLVVSRMSIYDK